MSKGKKSSEGMRRAADIAARAAQLKQAAKAAASVNVVVRHTDDSTALYTFTDYARAKDYATRLAANAPGCAVILARGPVEFLGEGAPGLHADESGALNVAPEAGE